MVFVRMTPSPSLAVGEFEQGGFAMEARDIIQNMANEGRNTREAFFHHQGNFLDRFRRHPQADDLLHEPTWQLGIDTLWYAYTAATVQKLANESGIPIPAWTRNPEYRLSEPYFQGNIQDDMRIVLLVTTPPEFMSHNLFVLPNVLDRY